MTAMLTTYVICSWTTTLKHLLPGYGKPPHKRGGNTSWCYDGTEGDTKLTHMRPDVWKARRPRNARSVPVFKWLVQLFPAWPPRYPVFEWQGEPAFARSLSSIPLFSFLISSGPKALNKQGQWRHLPECPTGKCVCFSMCMFDRARLLRAKG